MWSKSQNWQWRSRDSDLVLTVLFHYSRALPTVNTYCKLGGVNKTNVLFYSSGARNPTSRCRPSWFLQKAVRKNLFCASHQLLSVCQQFLEFPVMQKHHLNLCFHLFLFLLKYSWFNSLLPSSHSILPVCVFVCVQISFSIKTPYCHLGGPLCSSLSSSSLIKSTMTLFPKRVTF